MAAFSRGLRVVHQLPSAAEFRCSRCLHFSTTTGLRSGHNRWSKIKHDKGAADAKKNIKRSAFAHEITLASKLYGADPQTNPALATVLSNAKKAGFPKASIEAAIARGQGQSPSGATLEPLLLEVIMPSAVSVVIDVETDNRTRALADLRLLAKQHGGTVTPTSYLFKRRGRVQFARDERGLVVDDVLDAAIEAGAEDVEADEEGNLVVWTEPSETVGAAQMLAESMGLKLQSSDLLWDANEDTLVQIDSEEHLEKLKDFADALQHDPRVQGVYANAAQGAVNNDKWTELQEKIPV